jgi:hypothetical protein
MRKVAAIAAVAAVVSALLLWRQRDSRTTPEAAAAKPVETRTTTTAMAAIAPTLSPEATPPTDDELAETYPTDPERDQQVAAIHRQLLDAAAPCYRHRGHRPQVEDPTGPDETMQELRIRYTVVIAAGKGVLSNVERAEPDDPANTMGTPLQDEDLESCIVDAIAIAEWTTTDADETITIVDTITVGELDRPEPTRSPKPPMPAHPESIPPLATGPVAP